MCTPKISATIHKKADFFHCFCHEPINNKKDVSQKNKKVLSSLSNTINKYIAYVVVELGLSDSSVEPCLLAAQTSADGIKEATESCAEILTVYVFETGTANGWRFLE